MRMKFRIKEGQFISQICMQQLNFCNFFQNKADQGAAIYFYSLGNFIKSPFFLILFRDNAKKIDFNKNRFEQNEAFSEGGVIKWIEIQPIMKKTIFLKTIKPHMGKIMQHFLSE